MHSSLTTQNYDPIVQVGPIIRASVQAIVSSRYRQSQDTALNERCNEDQRRSAVSVSKILQGGESAEMPVEQPAKFELVDQSKNRNGARLHDGGNVPLACQHDDRMNRALMSAAPSGRSGMSASRPLLGAKQTRYAQSEIFRV